MSSTRVRLGFNKAAFAAFSAFRNALKQSMRSAYERNVREREMLFTEVLMESAWQLQVVPVRQLVHYKERIIYHKERERERERERESYTLRACAD